MKPTMYILTNHTNSVLYVGASSRPIQRTWQHKQKLVDGFSKKYKLYKLVYYELYNDMIKALDREKQVKKWNRKKKEELIEKINPEWRDLYDDIVA